MYIVTGIEWSRGLGRGVGVGIGCWSLNQKGKTLKF